MKKIVTMVVLLFTTYAFSQKESKDYTFFEKSNKSAPAGDEMGAVPSEPGDPAPIDDYLPLLAAAGVGMAVYFGRRKYMLTK